MGIGDNLMAAGLARGANARGKRIAFGDGKRIIWDINSPQIFRGNPNIAQSGSERDPDIEWIGFHKGNRIYNSQRGNRWVWHPDKFKAMPGEVFFDQDEVEFGKAHGSGFVIIEPNVPTHKSCAPNKQWAIDRWQYIARQFKVAGYRVVQFGYNAMRYRLKDAEVIETSDFRKAMAILSNARLAVLPEGGLHHAAAAVGVRAVVLFGGFIPPSVTGYDSHINLTGGAEACGSLSYCKHCRKAMEAISVSDVLRAADGILADG